MNASNTKNNHLFSKKKNISDSLTSVLQKNNTLVFTGLLSMGQMNPTKMEMALIGQHSEHLSLHAVSFETPHPTEKETSLSEPIKWTWSLNVVSFLKKLLVETGSSTSLNVHLIVHVEERFTPFVFALSFPEEITYKLLKECKVSYGKTAALLSTRPSQEGFVELSTVLLDKQTYATACKKQLPFLSKKEKEETEIWVMGNLPHMPGENSWSLFLTALDHFPGKEIYYILSPTSSAWKMAAKKAGDQLLSYGSEKYFNKLQSATLIVSEKAPYHLFPSASLFWEKRLTAKRVILPAHPLGLTNEPYTFNQHTIPWKIDSLIVSSKTEQRFVKDTLGLDETKTCLADLPNLQMASKIEKQPEKDLVLLAPSTRYPKWHSKEDEVSAPLIELCTDPLFTQWVADNHLQIMVLLTEENQGLKQDFAQLGIKTTTLSLFEDLLWTSKAKVMITDENPMAFEFALQERPVFFYQPSLYPYFSTTKRHAYEQTYQNELPGETAEDPQQMVHLLSQLKEQDYIMSRKNLKKARSLRAFSPDSSLTRTLACLTKVSENGSPENDTE